MEMLSVTHLPTHNYQLPRHAYHPNPGMLLKRCPYIAKP